MAYLVVFDVFVVVNPFHVMTVELYPILTPTNPKLLRLLV